MAGQSPALSGDQGLSLGLAWVQASVLEGEEGMRAGSPWLLDSSRSVSYQKPVLGEAG